MGGMCVCIILTKEDLHAKEILKKIKFISFYGVCGWGVS